jgi:HD superfamily phosphohydrolase
LLHDAPHTAFSHTVDILFPNDRHNYHEAFHKQVIMPSEIPEILRRNGIDLKAALEPEAYPLLEQPLPQLCADRIDYAFRDLVADRLVTQRTASSFLRGLVATEHGIALNSTDAALWFAHLFHHANTTIWAGPAAAGAYWALAGALRAAIHSGDFAEPDLFLTDDQAMAKLRASANPLVGEYLRLLEPGTHFYETGGRSPSFRTHMKQRMVDPQVLEAGWKKARPLSSISAEYAELAAARDGTSVSFNLWSDSISPALREALLGGARSSPGH